MRCFYCPIIKVKKYINMIIHPKKKFWKNIREIDFTEKILLLEFKFEKKIELEFFLVKVQLHDFFIIIQYTPHNVCFIQQLLAHIIAQFFIFSFFDCAFNVSVIGTMIYSRINCSKWSATKFFATIYQVPRNFKFAKITLEKNISSSFF